MKLNFRYAEATKIKQQNLTDEYFYERKFSQSTVHCDVQSKNLLRKMATVGALNMHHSKTKNSHVTQYYSSPNCYTELEI